MSIISQVRKQVVSNGKLRYGAASRIANLLGVSQDVVRRAIFGKRELDKASLEVLEKALAAEIPLFTVKASTICCDECKAPSHAKGKCRFHYFRAWRNGDFTE